VPATNDRADDLEVPATPAHARDERLVDLERVDGQTVEAARGRMAGSEIVDPQVAVGLSFEGRRGSGEPV
jgi:hypothetical protein